MLDLFKDLRIHGEGGDGGAGAAPGAAPAAEATGVTEQDAAVQEQPKKLTKAERRARVEEQLRAEQANGQQPQGEQKPDKQPFEEIEKLYHDEIGQKIQTAVTGRVKNLKDNEAALTAAQKELAETKAMLAQLAKEHYDIGPGQDGAPDIAAIKAAQNRSRAEEYALENGVSEEFAEQRIQMEDRIAEQDRQIREFQAAEAARQKDAEQFAQFQKHRQQAEAFRQKMPGFDLVKEMEASPVFAHLLGCGVNVENAYYAVHHEELMAKGQQAAATYATRALSTSIQAGQSLPVEGGLGRTPAASPQRVTDPRNMTRAQRAEIRRRAARGEEVYM